MRVGGRSAMVCVLALFATLLVPGTALSSPQPETFVTMISEPGDSIGGGSHRFFHPGNASITVSGNAEEFQVRVEGGNMEDYYSMDFAAPLGEELHVGEYERAQRAPFREATRPGIDIWGSGRGCTKIAGRFRVNQLETASDGTISKLWVMYEQHCGERTPALIGEVRINIVGDGGDVVTSQRQVRWRHADKGGGMVVVPIQMYNPGQEQVSMSAAKLAGPNANEFEVRVDGCAGKAIAPRKVCTVFVRYTPLTPGVKEASLRVPESDGDIHVVQLEGFVFGGSTRFALISDRGDWVGSGGSYNYDPSTANISVVGDHRFVTADIEGDDGIRWSASFEAPQGDILLPGGHYEDAKRHPFNGPSPGLSVYGDGHGCNESDGEFTVTEIDLNDEGELARFGVNFVQHCEGKTPALRGMLDFRVESPQPWPRIKSSQSARIETRTRRLVLNGSVFPENVTGTVSVLLRERTAGRWFDVARKQTRLNANGDYRVSFARSQRTWCKLIADYSGDDVYLPDRMTRMYPC